MRGRGRPASKVGMNSIVIQDKVVRDRAAVLICCCSNLGTTPTAASRPLSFFFSSCHLTRAWQHSPPLQYSTSKYWASRHKEPSFFPKPRDGVAINWRTHRRRRHSGARNKLGGDVIPRIQVKLKGTAGHLSGGNENKTGKPQIE